jgi:hypothetical protein
MKNADMPGSQATKSAPEDSNPAAAFMCNAIYVYSKEPRNHRSTNQPTELKWHLSSRGISLVRVGHISRCVFEAMDAT